MYNNCKLIKGKYMSGQITVLQGLLNEKNYFGIFQTEIPEDLGISVSTQQLIDGLVEARIVRAPKVPDSSLRTHEQHFNLKTRVQRFKDIYQNFDSYKSHRVRNALLLTLGTVVAAAIVTGLILGIMAGSHVAIVAAVVIGLTAWFTASYIEHRHDPHNDARVDRVFLGFIDAALLLPYLALSPIVLPLGLYLYDRSRKNELDEEARNLDTELTAFKTYIDNNHAELIRQLQAKLIESDQALAQFPTVDLIPVGAKDYAGVPGPSDPAVMQRILLALGENHSRIQRREAQTNDIQNQINHHRTALRELRDLALAAAAAR